MRTLRVLHVIGGGDTGGAMSHLLPLLSALEVAGADIRLLCLGEGGLADEARRRGLTVGVLPMDNPRDTSVLRPLRRLLATGPAEMEATIAGGAQTGRSALVRGARWDVVHTHGMRANLPVRLAMRGLRPRPCVFTTVHSDLYLDYASPTLARAYQTIDRVTVGFVDKVICVSDDLRSLLVRRGYPAGRLLTIYSGLEGLAQQAGRRRGVGVPPGDPGDTGDVGRDEPRAGGTRAPRIGTAARLVPVKDVGLLLEAAGFLRRETLDLEVVIVGDGPERARLEADAAALGFGGAARFAGQISDVRSILEQLDVYVVTSVYEGGVSMSVLEAMAQGLPVVAAAGGGVSEAVENNVTGFVVSRDQEREDLAAALAERIGVLLRDPELRARMGAAGAQRVQERFTIERVAKATLRAYERCLAAHGEVF